MSTNEVRKRIRADSKVNKYVEESLQICSIDQNRDVLCKHIDSFTDERRISHLRSLLYIWDSLTAQVNGRRKSCVLFSEAYDVFIAFSQYHEDKEQARNDFNLQNQFRTLLLHPTYGLRILIVKNNDVSWILLRPENVFLDTFFLKCNEVEKKRKGLLTKELLQQVVGMIDSEWDKKILRYVLSLLYTRKEIDDLGMDSDSVCSDKKSVTELLNSVTEIEQQAENDVVESLIRRRVNLVSEMSQKRRLLVAKRNKWTETQIAERKEEAEDIRQMINHLDRAMENRNNKSWRARIDRRKEKIIADRRLKKRKLGSGRKRLVDEEDERYVARCIEDKATAHGRRHDSRLHVGRRVKKKDFLKLVNRHHMSRNLPPVKSAMTVLNRGRAKRKNSVQAKRHIGLSLFCCKKSPKCEGRGNLLTHHCRALKKNIIRSLHAAVDSGLILYRSYDDKAYLCPETSTGMQSARKQKVFTSSNRANEKQFLKYDFPRSTVNITPGSFLYMEKEVEMIDGKEKILTTSYDALCRIKPKFFVGSGNSVWASHLMDNRHSEPVLHEIKTTSTHSSVFRSFCVKLLDTIKSFLLQTIEEDAKMISDGGDFLIYEKKKLGFLKNYVSESVSEVNCCTDAIDTADLLKKVQLLISVCEDVELSMENSPSGDEYWVQISEVIKVCKEIVILTESFPVPAMKPYVVDLTDAGPGVGITNHEVSYRISQEIYICKYDYYVRVHMAPDDSSSNEVERVQSSIGDAVCDGTYLNWEHYEKFAGMSEEELDKLTPAELESMEYDRMHRNAVEVAKEVNARIDGAPTIEGFLKSYVSKDLDGLFFWDTSFLQKYISLSDSRGFICPGYHFYTKLKTFSTSHFRKGEKYLEFVKYNCKKLGDSCDFCKTNSWYGVHMKSIPEPYPNASTGSYLHVKDTPTELNGAHREIDDFNPRTQLKSLFDTGDITVNDVDKIEEFASKFIVDKNLVLRYVKHMRDSKVSKESKKNERHLKKQNEEKKQYNDYDWKRIIEDGNLKKMVVHSLDKYISYHALDHLRNKNKPQKVEGIRIHFLRNFIQQLDPAKNTEVSSSEESSNEWDSSEDEVLITVNSIPDEHAIDDSDASVPANDESFEDPSLFTVNRYGRTVGSLR